MQLERFSYDNKIVKQFAFATILSVCGIKVLVIDELAKANLKQESFILDDYSFLNSLHF
mgnify:CR=1 FL=1